jgi:Clp amino terminal domain, pathogenicity island component
LIYQKYREIQENIGKLRRLAMWQRFTERARRVVFFAQEEAGAMGENYVSSEHLLLGIVRENDNVAAQVLTDMGVPPETIRAEVQRQTTRGEGVSGKDMQLTPHARRIIDLAYDEAKQLDNNYIGTEHMLLGILREGEGLGGRVLNSLGVEYASVRAMIHALQTKTEGSKEDGGLGEISGIKENLQRLKEAIKNRRQERQGPVEETLDTQAPVEAGPKRGDIGTLKMEERAVIEFVPAEADVAAFEDVMRIKDEYAYRELVTSGKILLLEIGTQAKFLQSPRGETYYVRILSGKLAGEVGYMLRAALQDVKPDDRPFPPPIKE